MKARFTKPPHTVRHGSLSSEIYASGLRSSIADCHEYTGALDADERRANATLFGAAAEMLSVLRMVRDFYRNVPNYTRDGATVYFDASDLLEIDSIIAKATAD